VVVDGVVVVVGLSAPVEEVVESATRSVVVVARTVVSAGSDELEQPASTTSAMTATLPDREIKVPLQGCRDEDVRRGELVPRASLQRRGY
jgi:hypothetical protein